MTDALHDEDDRRTRRVLWSLPTGLMVVAAGDAQRDPGGVRAMTVNLVMQVATEPRVVAISMETESHTLEATRNSGIITLSLLGVDERALIRKFVKPTFNGVEQVAGASAMAGVAVTSDADGYCWLDPSVAMIGARVTEIIELGSHALVVAEVHTTREFGDQPLLTMRDTKMNYGG